MSEREVVTVAETTIKNLAALAEKKPDASIKADDFNALLRRAREAFPGSQAIQDLKEIEGLTTLADLFAKLSVIAGAGRATFAERNAAAMRERNEALRRGIPSPRYGGRQ